MDSHLEKYQTGSVFHTVHQDKFQIGQKCKPKHISTERKHGDWRTGGTLAVIQKSRSNKRKEKKRLINLATIKIKEHPLEKESKLFLSLTYTQRKPTIDEVKT